MEFLRNVSKEEAINISKLAEFVIENDVFDEEEILNRNGLHLDFLFKMQDIGIIFGIGAIGLLCDFE